MDGRGLLILGPSGAGKSALALRMLASGALHQPGVIVPERLGQIAGIPEALIDGLRARGIHYSERETIT